MLALAVLARNLSPSPNHGMYPLQVVTDRGDCVGRLRLIHPPPNPHAKSTEEKSPSSCGIVYETLWNSGRQ